MDLRDFLSINSWFCIYVLVTQLRYGRLVKIVYPIVSSLEIASLTTYSFSIFSP